jgi:hypothetical protein
VATLLAEATFWKLSQQVADILLTKPVFSAFVSSTENKNPPERAFL